MTIKLDQIGTALSRIEGQLDEARAEQRRDHESAR
jgi:hypothetical protein